MLVSNLRPFSLPYRSQLYRAIALLLIYNRTLLTDIVKLLVSNGALVGTKTKDSKETPLHLSSANGHLGVVRERQTPKTLIT